MKYYAVLITMGFIIVFSACGGNSGSNDNCSDATCASLQSSQATLSSDATSSSISSISDNLIAIANLDATVTRDGGEGSCGVAPWGVDHINGGDFSCVPPKYWYNHAYWINATQILTIVPSNAGYQLVARGKGVGRYEEAESWDDGQRICAPSDVEAANFDFNVSGAAVVGQATLTITMNPTEIALWECNGGSSYSRETTLVHIDTGLALSGSYTDISVLFETTNAFGKGYRIYKTLDTNPSPDNRDHVNLQFSLDCFERNISNPVECPW